MVLEIVYFNSWHLSDFISDNIIPKLALVLPHIFETSKISGLGSKFITQLRNELQQNGVAKTTSFPMVLLVIYL